MSGGLISFLSLSHAATLKDADFPVTAVEYQPLDHPKIKVLRRLAEEHSGGFRRGTEPEKTLIVKQIVDAVKPREGGCCRRKTEAGWEKYRHSHQLEAAVVQQSVRDTLLAVSESEVQVFPAKDDILCGRGQHSVRHHGNQQFRSRCSKVEFAYNLVQRNLAKQAIVKQLYSDFKNDGIRFLKFNRMTGTWTIMPYADALDKIRQCIMDTGKPRRKRNGYIGSASSVGSAFTVSLQKCGVRPPNSNSLTNLLV